MTIEEPERTSIKIGFTGTRQGMTDVQRDTFEAFLKAIVSDRTLNLYEFHHGMCPKGGADLEAETIARECGLRIVGHPMKGATSRTEMFPYRVDETLPIKPPLERNHDIVNETTLLLATPAEMEKPSSLIGNGTWTTIGYGIERGKDGTYPVVIFFPNGSLTVRT